MREIMLLFIAGTGPWGIPASWDPPASSCRPSRPSPGRGARSSCTAPRWSGPVFETKTTISLIALSVKLLFFHFETTPAFDKKYWKSFQTWPVSKQPMWPKNCFYKSSCQVAKCCAQYKKCQGLNSKFSPNVHKQNWRTTISIHRYGLCIPDISAETGVCIEEDRKNFNFCQNSSTYSVSMVCNLWTTNLKRRIRLLHGDVWAPEKNRFF